LVIFGFGITAVDGVMAGRVAVGIIAVFVVAFVVLAGVGVTIITDRCDSWRCVLFVGAVAFIRAVEFIEELIKLNREVRKLFVESRKLGFERLRLFVISFGGVGNQCVAFWEGCILGLNVLVVNACRRIQYLQFRK